MQSTGSSMGVEQSLEAFRILAASTFGLSGKNSPSPVLSRSYLGTVAEQVELAKKTKQERKPRELPD